MKYLKKFENHNRPILLYYALDFDDNILYMPTKIHMEKLVDGEWIPTDVSTSEFAEVRNNKENWRLLNNSPDVAFSEFRDIGPRGNLAFLEDLRHAINLGKYGPAWDDFIECLTNGSLFAIITARGHESPSMRIGIEWIIDNILSEEQLYEMYNHLMKFEYLFNTNDNNDKYDRFLKGTPSKNSLVKSYLDSCQFVGVSAPSRGGSPSNPEKAKEEALLEFKEKVNDYASRIGTKAKIGFSDDDSGNVKHIEDLIDNLNHERFPNIIQYVVKGTKDPSNISKKVRSVTETSHQAPGLESSVLPFTSFNNMTNRLYPKSLEGRQDDFTNQFRRQTEYLAKISKDLKKTRKKKKIRK
jgi:hypothetical protein